MSATSAGPTRTERVATALLCAFGAVAALDLLAVAAGNSAVEWASKPLLAPLLLGYLWLLSRRVDGVVIGLVFATGGDVALLRLGDVAFLAGMACFLITQLAFITAFVRFRRPLPTMLVGYLVLWAGANIVLWVPLGDLAVPILGYSLALFTMAATAAAVSVRAGVGGALFVLSDLLIGLGAAGIEVPGRGLLVMSTYIAALYLIVTAWARRGTDRRPLRRR